MKFVHLFAAVLLTLSASVQAAEAITVAVAANVKFAFEDLSVAFTKETGIAVKPIVSSSGKLTAQIKHGAPYDVFLSADMRYPASLHKAGLAVAAPQVYAHGTLVLWTRQNTDLSKGIALVADTSIRKVAIANPKLAPYGKQAMKALDYYQLTTTVLPKLVYGESISQVNQYIDLKAVDIGFTAKSVVLSPKLKGRGTWVEVPNESYQAIAQGLVVLKHGAQHHANAAQLFATFMQTKTAQNILVHYGYQLP